MPISIDVVDVPDVTGDTEAEATSTLEALGLTVSVTYVRHETVGKNLVISQESESVEFGTQINLVVSLGPVPEGGLASRPRRQYVVEIDGQEFVTDSLEAAQELLGQAKALAPKAAEADAQKVVVRPGTPIPKTPQIRTREPDLQFAVAQARREINRIYSSALRDAEIRVRLQKKLSDEDDDDLISFLM